MAFCRTRAPYRAAAMVALAALGIAGAAPLPVHAQDAAFPTRPVRIIVGFSAGAFNDIMVRSIAPKISERLGQPVVVENRPGAGANIAAETVARAAPDGYTLLSAPTSTYVINPFIYSKLAYDPVRDFAPVSHIANFALFLAVPGDLPVKTVDELVAYAKANPTKANYGSVAPSFELLTAMMMKQTGMQLERIPFKSTMESMTALLTGQVIVAYQDYNSMAQHLKAGKVKPLVALGSKRSVDLPEIPTGKEAGHPYLEFDSLTGIVVPKATPAPIVARLEAAVMYGVKHPETVARWRSLGMIPVGSSAAEFARTLESESRRWSDVQKATGIKLD